MIAHLFTAFVGINPACEAAFEDLRSFESIEAAYVSHVAFVRADAGDGELRWFLIDTGANRSALDTGVAVSLGLPNEGTTRVEGSAGVVEMASTTLPGLSLGGVTTSLSPTVSDLSGLAGPDGEPVAGILGSDLFGDQVLVLDFERGRLALRPTDSASGAAAACGRGAAMTNDNGIPRITGEIDGRPTDLRYDSGASLFDSPHLWINITEVQHEALLDGGDPGPPIAMLSGSGVGGQIQLPVHQAGRFRLGEIEWAEPRLIVQPRVGYFAREEAVGFLGNAAFEPFGMVVIDYGRGRLTVPPEMDASGSASSPAPRRRLSAARRP